MSKLIIEFQHTDVMQSKPWPIGIDADNIVKSGLGPDDGALLIGFGPFGEQSVSVMPEDARKDPATVVGMSPSFSNAGGLFSWFATISALAVVEA